MPWIFSLLTFQEPPPVDPVPEGPAEAEPKEQGDLGALGALGGQDQEVAVQPVSSPKPGPFKMSQGMPRDAKGRCSRHQ